MQQNSSSHSARCKHYPNFPHFALFLHQFYHHFSSFQSLTPPGKMTWLPREALAISLNFLLSVYILLSIFLNLFPLLWSHRWVTWQSYTGRLFEIFFGGCVLHRFPKVGSREHIFLEKWGLGNDDLENLHLESLNFSQNKAENAKFFLKLENGGGGGTWAALWLKIGTLGSADWPEKKWGHTAAHPHITFQCECPPGSAYQRFSSNRHLRWEWTNYIEGIPHHQN